MSRRIADLLIKIGADSYEFQQKAQQVEKGLGSLEKKLTSVGKSLSLKLTAPLAALGGVSLHLADVQAKAETKVQQALKVTNQAVGYNFRQLVDYASELQGKTLFGDETILDKSTARLLAFTNITGENFKRTQALALDLATALEMDLGSASLQLGKALSDPATKLSSLSRAGITFSKEQTEVIKKLAETGDIAKAQAMILDELERKFGGQAEAAARTGLGAVQQLKNAWGDFLERIGAAIMPFATKIAGALSTVVQMLQSMSPAMMQTIVIVAGLVAAVGPPFARNRRRNQGAADAGGGIYGIAVARRIDYGGGPRARCGIRLRPHSKAKNDRRDGRGRIARRARTQVAGEYRRAERHHRHDDQDADGSEFRGIGRRIYLAESTRRIETRTLAQGVRSADGSYREETRTEKKVAEAQAELDKVTDEARKQTEELMKSIAGTNAQTEQSTGIIGKLQARIEALEKKKLLPESTVEDIAEANAEIEKLRKELERIRNIKPADLTPVVKMDGILPEGFELELPAPKLKMGDLKPVTSQYAQQMQTIFGAVREGLYGWADDNSAYLQEHVADTVSMVENYTTALTAKGWSFSAALEHVHATIAEVMTRFDQQVSKFMADSIVAAAEAIGQIIAGDLGFGGLMKAILTQFASFLKNIGSQLIEFGVMIIAFKSALKSVLANPWAAIAIGAAMVAAAAVMTALINKNAEKSVPALTNGGLAYGPTYAMVGDNPNAGTDPEVIAPLSKLQAMLPTGGNAQNLRITLGGQLTAKGRDLVYVLGKENFKSEVLGG